MWTPRYAKKLLHSRASRCPHCLRKGVFESVALLKYKPFLTKVNTPKRYYNKSMSKRGDNLKRWKNTVPQLIQKFNDLGVYSCELRLDKKCTGRLFCGIAHRHPRVWYINKPVYLTDMKHLLIACQSCHEKLDHFMTDEEKDIIFKDLRG